jgi:hypothetical protein
VVLQSGLSWTDRSVCAKNHRSLLFVSNSLCEKLLDDTEALLYCDPEFDRHFDLS